MGDIEHDHGDEAGTGNEIRATTGAGVESAAFPVGALAGAAVGGVGGALVGDETAADADSASQQQGRRAEDSAR